MKYYIFGICLLDIVLIKKEKILVIKEKKLWLYLKKLIKRYQIFQPHMKKILMLYILVEYLHSTICQNLFVNSSSCLNEEENNKGTCIIFWNYYLKLLIFFCFNRFPRFSNS